MIKLIVKCKPGNDVLELDYLVGSTDSVIRSSEDGACRKLVDNIKDRMTLDANALCVAAGKTVDSADVSDADKAPKASSSIPNPDDDNDREGDYKSCEVLAPAICNPPT